MKNFLALFALFMMSININATTSWTFDKETGTLTISGTGAMPDFDYANNQSWKDDRNNITSVVIEDGVTSIGKRSFYDCVNLTSVEIPTSVTTIKESAFYNCASLKSVTFKTGSTLKTIGSNAFIHSGLTSFTIPNTVTTIGGSAFSQTNLTSITIPKSVTGIGSEAFYNCSKLTTVTFESETTIKTIESGVFQSCPSLASVTIPKTVTEIKESAFNECFELATVTFEAGSVLQKIGASAFHSTGITTLTIPASVTKVDGYVFSSCKNLTTVTFEAGAILETIGYSMFYECTGLKSVTIPESVTKIDGYAFNSCTSLSSITYLGSTPPSIGEYAFSDCNNITSVNVPKEAIEDYQKAQSEYKKVVCTGSNCGSDVKWAYFPLTNKLVISGTGAMDDFAKGSERPWNEYTKTPITSVVIEDGVTSIGNSAFLGFTDLTAITLPATVTSIGSSAFFLCNHLTSITCLSQSGVTVGSSAFGQVYSIKTIFVPKNSKSEYTKETTWKSKEGGIFEIPDNNTLTIPEKGWASMYLGWNVTVPEGATAYYAYKAESNKVKLKTIKSGEIIPAYTAVIVNSAAGTKDFAYASTSAAPIDDNLFKGVTANTTCEANSNYVLNATKSEANAPVLSLFTGTSLTAFKAYLPASVIPSDAKDIIFAFDDETTSIENLDAVRSLELGVRSYYNLAGQKVGNDYKGVVIINGKKYLNR